MVVVVGVSTGLEEEVGALVAAPAAVVDGTAAVVEVVLARAWMLTEASPNTEAAYEPSAASAASNIA